MQVNVSHMHDVLEDTQIRYEWRGVTSERLCRRDDIGIVCYTLDLKRWCASASPHELGPYSRISSYNFLCQSEHHHLSNLVTTPSGLDQVPTICMCLSCFL